MAPNAYPSLDALDSMLPHPLGERLRPHARIVQRPAGHIVMGHGERSSDLYLIIEGQARAELHSPSGREVILGDLGPGELIGEFAALDDQPRTATVEVVSPCTLAAFPGPIFRAAVFADPASAEWIARRFVGHIRLLTEKLFELNALAVRNRLHCELLRLGITAGIADNQAVIAPAPTHVHLAGRIGSHREAVTRELQYLQREGIVAQQGRRLAILDVARLAEIVRAAAGDVEMVERAAPAAVGPAAVGQLSA
ncbi:Crp/Fnr family transcriptional regulator [Sphingosinicella sp. CPCC 101087]|uniref:Crp/Fnr family transcriptional regulator n=1 Tax=Sphingosinicella sp. CPCC 101087 TaxID=2497754 RepID=UPI00101DBF48|nr:Crp/Fnr family transcriptional regulator [Sphingosinicella sp. CPCC 101087]